MKALDPFASATPEDPRIRGAVEGIGRDLMVDGLVLRYQTTQMDDGLTPGERGEM